jgi:hypothetical protein
MRIDEERAAVTANHRVRAVAQPDDELREENPESFLKGLDCFVVIAPRNDGRNRAQDFR